MRVLAHLTIGYTHPFETTSQNLLQWPDHLDADLGIILTNSLVLSSLGLPISSAGPMGAGYHGQGGPGYQYPPPPPGSFTPSAQQGYAQQGGPYQGGTAQGVPAQGYPAQGFPQGAQSAHNDVHLSWAVNRCVLLD